MFNLKSQLNNEFITGASKFSIDTLAIQNSQNIIRENKGLLEKEIDPEKYILGPDDVIALSIIGGPKTKQYDLTISPEGRVIIPDVGVVDLKRKTLKEAEELITKKVSTILKYSDISILLKELKKFKISIGGLISKPITVPATSVDRVSEVIDKAGGLKFNSSLRKIKIIRNDGAEIINVDLLRFYNFGDKDKNPYLQGGDHIVIPASNENSVIEISGEVSFEGKFEFVEGDSLSTLIKFGLGFLNTSFLDSVEYISYNDERTNIIKKYVNLSSWKESINDKKPLVGDFPLKDGDRIYIRKIAKWQKPKYISIAGEVKYPGRYAISDNMRISDVLELAGGFTKDGDVEQTNITRWEFFQWDEAEMERIGKLTVNERTETENLYYQSRVNEQKALMSLDFSKIIKDSNSQDNVVLMNKDSIYVPKYRDFIEVQGRVNNPGIMKFKKNADYLDYINQAGGFGYNADESSVLIVKLKSQTKFLAKNKNYKIEPGDKILIPPKTDFSYLNLLTVTAQIVSVLGVIIALTRL
jgi:protein involved in polysaccharide export with SLBB domain